MRSRLPRGSTARGMPPGPPGARITTAAPEARRRCYRSWGEGSRPERAAETQMAGRAPDNRRAWPLGRLAAWPLGRLAAWPLGRLAAWPLGRLAAWPLGRLAAWPLGRLAAWPLGRLAAYSTRGGIAAKPNLARARQTAARGVGGSGRPQRRALQTGLQHLCEHAGSSTLTRSRTNRASGQREPMPISWHLTRPGRKSRSQRRNGG